MTRLLVALTGAIGSGKSAALDAFKRAGAHVISTDAIAHELSGPGGAAARAVGRRFGKDVLSADGAIDRKRLAAKVFRSPADRRALEKLLHPKIMAESRKRARAVDGVVVVEVPLLFEAGFAGDFDLAVAVSAPDAVRRRRMRARGLDAGEISRREKAQLSAAEKARRADVVLKNSDGLGALRREAARLYRAFALIADAAQKRGR